MKRISFLLIVCFCSLFVYSQNCEELTAEYEYLEAKYKKLDSNSEKKECVKQMELVVSRSKEIDCEFPQKWYRTLRQRKQALYPSSLFVQGSYNFNYNEGFATIAVKSKKNLKLVSYPDWLELLETDDSKGYDFSIVDNQLPYERSGNIEITDGKKQYKCIVTQAGVPLEAKVTESLGFGQDGGVGLVFVETNDTAWTVSSGCSWLTVQWADFGARVYCNANPEKKTREAIVKVKLAQGEVRKVKISQKIGRTTLSVPNKNFSFDNFGGINNDVEVKCNYEQWSASTDASWVKVEKKYGGISINCLPNQLATSRTARITIETDDADHLVEYINVTQEEAPAYLITEKTNYSSDGSEKILYIPVESNIPDWVAEVSKGSSWAAVSRTDNYLRVSLKRNDWNTARSASINIVGKSESRTIYISQPNRGYKGRYKDYFDANGGDWHLTWFSVEASAMTAIGVNVAAMNVRWKPVEVSLVNLNMNYNFLENSFNLGWEPIVRGFLPVSRNGRWAAFVGMGAHVDFIGDSHFLVEFGMETQWNEKNSSRIFFRYNGGSVLGMSFDIGNWY